MERAVKVFCHFFLWLLITHSLLIQAAGPGGVETNLQLWLKADDGITESGGSISSWADQSPNAKNGTQASSTEQPTFISNKMNFNPSVEFNATTQTDGDYLEGPDGLGVDDTTTLTTFFVMQQDNVVDSVDDFFTFATDDASGDHRFGIFNSGTSIVIRDSTFGWVFVADGLSVNIPTAGAPMLLTSYYDGATYTFTESVSNVSASDTETLGIDGDNGASAYRIGRDANDSFDGDIMEVAIFERTLPANEINQVQSYLALKYGMTLPTSVTNYVNSGGSNIWTDTT